MFETRYSQIKYDNSKIKNSPKYEPFKLYQHQETLVKSVYEIQSQMKTRQLSNIRSFYQNQNIKPTNSLLYTNGQYRSGFMDRNLDYTKNKEINQQLHTKFQQKQQKFNQPSFYGQIKSQKQNEKKQGLKSNFTYGSCLLLILSLVILSILAGLLYLIYTNQVQKYKQVAGQKFNTVKYQVLSKLGLQNSSQQTIYYGSALNSHPVIELPIIKPNNVTKFQNNSTKNNKSNQTTTLINQPKILNEKQKQIEPQLNSLKIKKNSLLSTKEDKKDNTLLNNEVSKQLTKRKSENTSHQKGLNTHSLFLRKYQPQI